MPYVVEQNVNEVGVVVGDLELQSGILRFELSDDLHDGGHDLSRTCAWILDDADRYRWGDRSLLVVEVPERATALPIRVLNPSHVSDVNDFRGRVRKGGWARLGYRGPAHALVRVTGDLGRRTCVFDRVAQNIGRIGGAGLRSE